MDAFDNPAKGGMGSLQHDGLPTDQVSRATAGDDLLAGAATVTAAAAAIPLAIQGVLVPDASGRIVLPAGVSIDDITVSGTDLIIALPSGQVLIIPNGAVDIPSIVVDGNVVPGSTVAQLLEGLDDLNPEAGLRSSGGNFADPEGNIQDAYALGDLLPYTELAFPVPEDEEQIPDVPDEEPTTTIVTPDQPAGSVNATASVNEAGLPARSSEPAGSNSAANSETTIGTIVINAPDGLASVTINGTAVTAVGQTITTPLGTLTITSIALGAIGYSYTLADNTDANANPADVFAVVVTDVDGDTATANLTISVIDDVPTARADTDAVAPATFTAETGNVISGVGTTSGAAGADTQGADGAVLNGITAGTGTTFVAPGTVIQGQYGTLTIDAQGNYSYVRGANTPGGVTDVFTYRLTDGDGDTSTATLTISIGDSPSVITFIPTEGAGTVVDESQLPPRSEETPGSAFDGDDETTTGTITFTSRDGVGSVTINGVAVTPGALPQQISSDATGTLVITSYSYDPVTGEGSITYSYTLNDNTLNPDGTTVSFDVVVTDLDGDVADGDLNIRIIDDVPTAVNDVDSATEDGPLVADGNVLTGVGGGDANATDGVADTPGADGATVTAVSGGTVGTAFATTYGTLTLNADGSYTYALNNAAQPVQGLSAGETLTEVFTYTITDGDGDTSTATLTITINGADDGVTITGLDADGGELVVDEDDLPSGSSPDAGALTQPGSFSIATPDGLGNVTIGGTQVVTNGIFTAGTATSPLGTVNITGFIPILGADGSVIGGTFTYEYVFVNNTLTHTAPGEDNVTDSFAVTVTDSDGSAADASLDVVIIDDVPAAVNDADSATEDGPLVADGNVLTGVGGGDANATDGVADTPGADGATVTAVSGGTVGTAFATAYGTLTLNADGSYTYALNNAAQPVQGLSAGETLTETFEYEITDGDGDTATATLTITINGADDGVTINGLDGAGAELLFDEDDLPARVSEPAGSDSAPEPVTDGGSFSVATPDGMGSVVLDSFNGAPIGPLTLVTADGTFTPQSVTTAYGTLSIIGFTPLLGADGSVIGGSFTYSYTLTDNRTDHGLSGEDSLSDSIGITVTDSDGSSASANIDVAVTDDVPTAADDFQMQPVENQPVTINVLANDTQGADGVQPSTVQFVDGSLTGAGTLVNNGDGTFTYTQAPGEIGEVSFQYEITDGDGDTSIATATIMLVADSTPQIRQADNVTVDEDGLPGANLDNSRPGEVVSTGSATASGAIVIDFGGDVPATLAGSLVINDSAALDTQLTVGAVAVTFAKDGADLVGSVGGVEVIRISITGVAAGPGTTEISYSYSVTLSQSIDQVAAGEDTDLLSAIGFTVTDNDGSTASGSFGVTIVDDIPAVTVTAGADAGVLLTTQDAQTDGDPTDSDVSTASFAALFTTTPVYGADGAGTTVTSYALGLVVAPGAGSGLASNGAPIFLYNIAGVITGSTSATIDGVLEGNTIFTLGVNASTGLVTLTQLAEIDHALPGDPSDYDAQLATLANGLVQLTATATTTDGDGDTATGTASIDLGGNVRFADDGPSVTVALGSDAALVLTTQDAETDGNSTAEDVATANVAGLFTVTPTYGADGAGTTTTSYTMALLVAPGTGSGLDSNGAPIFLYNIAGVVTGSTSATIDGVLEGNTIFTVAVNSSTGLVTLTQLAEIDHALPGDPSNYDAQLATLANGLIGVTATATTTDGDGDTATAAQTLDLGGNINFADDGPSVTVTLVANAAVVLTTQDAETDDGPGDVDVATANVAGLFTVAPTYGADGAGTTTTSYAMALLVAAGTDSGLDSNGASIFLYNIGGVITGSTENLLVNVAAGNTIFTVGVNASSGLVTLTQLAEIDHALPGDPSDYDAQLATLANGLIGVTATATTTDGDGDTATAAQTLDLGGNINFADDGPAVTVTAGADAGVLLTTQDAQTDGDPTDSDVSTASFAALFTTTPVYGADGAGTTVTSYALGLVVAPGAGSGLASNGAPIFLYNIAGVITGSTSATIDGVLEGNTIFTLGVNASTGLVTLTQLAEIDHALPGDPSDYDAQLATLANGLVQLTATATTTDGDGDTATGTASIDLGGNVRFADDGPSVTVALGSDAALVLTTQDAETDGNPTAEDVATANVAGLFTVTPTYGADGAGTTTTSYTMALLVAPGTGSGLDSNGAPIFLYNIAGVVTGSTSATIDGVLEGNTIFTVAVNSSTGLVTLTQLAEIDHALPGDPSNYDAQLATLANGLIGVTATATTTDGDGDTATAAQTLDLGGNINFADDGPSVTVTLVANAAVVLTTQDAETDDGPGDVDVATANVAGLFTVAPTYGADGAGTTTTSYAMALLVAAGTDSGLDSNGASIFLYNIGGVITGSTENLLVNVAAGNTIFTVGVNASSGLVTLTQLAEIDHALPGDPSDYDAQLATLANGLIGVTATATTTDGDGDTATAAQTLDLGGNINFADDGPAVTVTAGADAGVLLTTQDAQTDGDPTDSDVSTASFAALFTTTPVYGADGAGTTVTSYALGLVVAPGAGSGLASNGAPIFLYNIAGVITGSTSATIDGVLEGNTIFTLGVNASTGLVTLTQLAEIDHALPGDPSDYDAQLATLANGLVQLTATATTTDGDGDTATGTASIDLGGNVRFADDGPSVTVALGSDAALVLTTQDAETDGNPTAEDVATANVAGLFTVTPTYGADGAGTTTTSYTMALLVAPGTGSGLDSNGAPIFLYNIAGVVTGSTSATIDGVLEGNTIFTVAVNSSTGLVTLTQLAEIDHALPGDPSNYDAQLATLANGLIGVTATATTTDGDGDTATAAQTLDLGGNINFADDGPSVTVTLVANAAVVLTTQDAETDDGPGDVDVATANVAGLFTVAPTYGADGAGTTTTSYAMALLVAAGTDSGLDSNGASIFLYNIGGVITGSTENLLVNVAAGNTIFTVGVNASSGLVTLTQLAEIDHALPGDPSDYDAQLATLANGLIGVTATATTTDGDGDTATAAQTLDLGGNINFADDGPAVTVTAGADAGVLLTTQDAQTDGDPTDSDVSTASFAALFTTTPVYGADGAGTTVTSYALGLVVAPGAGSGLASNGAPIFLYNIAGVITGSTSATIDGVLEGNTIFTLGVNASTGLVTLTQLAEIDHALPGDPSDYDAQLATLANGLVQLTATATTTDGDGDTATGTASIDLGGNVRFADDGPSVTVALGSDAALVLTTQDAETDGNPTAEDVATANVAGLFTVTPTYGADGAGTTTTSYTMALLVAPGTGSGLDSNGAPIFLYNIAGVVTGSTSATIDGVLEGNTIFTVAVNSSTGLVTLTQLAEIDHALPGDPSNYDAQLATLANGLIGVTATATTTDGDGDTATAAQTLDLGGNINFADDGPSAVLSIAGLSLAHDETPGIDGDAQDVAGPLTIFDGVGNQGDDPHVAGTVIGFARDIAALSSIGSTFGADGAGTTSFGLALSADGVDSGLDTTDGQNILLYLESGIVVGRVGGPAGVAAFAIAVEADGSVNLVQYLSIKHPTTGVSHDESVSIINGSLLATVTVTDGDGDGDVATTSAPIGGLISFQDDGPTLGAFTDVTVVNATNAIGNGTFAYSAGADGHGSFTISGPALPGITYTTVQNANGALLSATTDPDGPGGNPPITVFTLQVNIDGTYAFTLVTPQAASTETVSLLNLSAGGPTPFVQTADGRVEFTGSGGGINSSTQGFGVANQFVGNGESFTIEFHNPGAPGDQAPLVNPDYVSSIVLKNDNINGSLLIKVTVFNDALGTSEVVYTNFNVTGTSTLIDPVMSEFNRVLVEGVGGSGQGVRFTSLDISRTILPNDIDLQFNVTALDGDGDVTSVSMLNVFVDAGTPPIAFDLDGNGVEFLSIAAGVTFDYHGTGAAVGTAWVGPNDGLLVFDGNGNGVADNGTELVFGGNGLTDLQGLAARFDSNKDGVLDAADAEFGRFAMWQDANSNGVTDAGELRTLEQAGIVSINLVSDGAAYAAANGSVYVYGESGYQLTDGTVRTVADAAFATNGSQSSPNGSVRTQDRPASAMLMTDALVAASLVAVVGGSMHIARAVPEAFGMLDSVTGLQSQQVAATVSGSTPPSLGLGDDTPSPTADSMRIDGSVSASSGDAVSAALSADTAEVSWQSASDPQTDATESTALFDLVADNGPDGSGLMDGLLLLAVQSASQPAEAAIAANDPAADAVLAEVVGSDGVDLLLNAIAGGAPEQVAIGDAPTFDLANFLKVQVTPDAAFPTSQPLEQELHQLTAA